MESSDYIAICAAIISFVALGLGIYQSHLTRKHNKLSIRPILSISKVSSYDRGLSYTLLNNGLGPAIIKKFGVMIDDKLIESSDNIIFSALEKIGVEHFDVGYFTLESGEAYNVGEELLLLGFVDKESNPDKYANLDKVMPRFKFYIEYECIYGDKFKLQSNGS
ncbi:hypothetical protein ACOQ0N_001467 [Vibrio parahaemolyticus]